MQKIKCKVLKGGGTDGVILIGFQKGGMVRLLREQEKTQLHTSSSLLKFDQLATLTFPHSKICSHQMCRENSKNLMYLSKNM